MFYFASDLPTLTGDVFILGYLLGSSVAHALLVLNLTSFWVFFDARQSSGLGGGSV